MRTRSVRAGRRCAAVLLAAVTGSALLAGCALPDQRVDGEQRDGKQSDGSASAEASFTPKVPVPSGKPLGADARVPRPKKVDERDAGAVSKAWAETAYGYDTAYDASPYDAKLRAARWLTDRRRATEREYRPAGAPGPEWTTWAGHRAWTTVDVSSELEDDAPRDSRSLAYRSLVVKGTAHGRDGWKGTGPRLNAYVKLVRSANGKQWRVDDVTVVEAATAPPPSSDAP
ncbi:hypothetical protein ACFVW2_27040 [Streptomyces sp. NPDC058171]